jgi:hypothetical protein
MVSPLPPPEPFPPPDDPHAAIDAVASNIATRPDTFLIEIGLLFIFAGPSSVPLGIRLAFLLEERSSMFVVPLREYAM